MTSDAPDRPPAARLAAGVWCTSADRTTAAVLARAGFDWLCLDTQHGRCTQADLGELVPAAAVASTRVLVRVEANTDAAIGRALDAGASGVVVPMVDSVEQARSAAAACRYPPRGRRSWGPLALTLDQEPPSAGAADAATVCAVMVETPRALAEVERLADVDGVDALFVGPFDLSLALGTDLETLLQDHSPDAALPRVVRACRGAGITAGAFAGTPQRAAQLHRFGFTMVAVATDTGLLAGAARTAAADARALLG